MHSLMKSLGRHFARVVRYFADPVICTASFAMLQETIVDPDRGSGEERKAEHTVRVNDGDGATSRRDKIRVKKRSASGGALLERAANYTWGPPARGPPLAFPILRVSRFAPPIR